MEDTTSPSGLLSHIYSPDAGTSYSRSKVRVKNKSAAVAPKSKPEGIGAHKKSNCKEKVSDNTSERGHLSLDNTLEVTLKTKNVVPEPVKRSNSLSLRKPKSLRRSAGTRKRQRSTEDIPKETVHKDGSSNEQTPEMVSKQGSPEVEKDIRHGVVSLHFFRRIFRKSKEENDENNSTGVDNMSEAKLAKKEILEQAMVVHGGQINLVKIEWPTPSFSLGLTQLETRNTPAAYPKMIKSEDALQNEHGTPIKAANTNSEVPSAFIARPLGVDMDRIYKWATNHRIKDGLTLAAITNGDNIELGRSDLKDMGGRGKLSDALSLEVIN
ncbi:hypothetical protein PIB30_046789 [Stylosanthes scabra]|uniref:SAM domain-containing protein n=1 Tax=Stylosanthes scabra TaxID=79078 RepID=A0ABU6ZFB6_9FABA|nr:hypothetical protein [Stylosanthes scabra]